MRHIALPSCVIKLADAHDLRCGELIEALELSSGDDKLSLGARYLRTQILCSDLRGRVIQFCNELTCFDSLPDIGHPNHASSYDAGDACVGATYDRAWNPAICGHRTRGDCADLHGHGRSCRLICGVPTPGGDDTQE